MKYWKTILTAISVLMLTGISNAAPFGQVFKNDFQIDGLYLFITKGDVEFTKLQQAPKNWNIEYGQPDRLSVIGPVIEPGEIFRVKFSDRGTFTLEWAELLRGAIVGSGSLFSKNGNFVGANGNFTYQSQIAAPITGSLWLLGSGLVCLLSVRRKFTTLKTYAAK